MTIIHLPVLAKEVADLLSPKEGGIYVDATVGLGGHAELLLEKIGHSGRVIGIDRDDEALRRTAERIHDERLVLRKGSFSGMGELVRAEGIGEVDGILLDLGVSMMQLKDQKRGFSFTSDERLDMRMDTTQSLSAWDVINASPEQDLVRILREYGEEYRAARIVKWVAEARRKKTIDTCAELAGIVERAIGRSGRTHPATRTFQALRIEVNREMQELEEALQGAPGILKKGGRFCVISYHSLEDRIVKNFIRDNAKKMVLLPLVKKPLVAGMAEKRENPSSRSAKLRGAEKL